MIVYFLFQSIISIIIFMIFLLIGNYGDGYIGMAPLSMLIAVCIQFVVSTVIYYSIKNFIKSQNNYIFIIIHMIMFELSFLIFTYSSPIVNIFEEDFKGFVSRCESFSSLISGAIVLIIYFIKRNNYKV